MSVDLGFLSKLHPLSSAEQPCLYLAVRGRRKWVTVSGFWCVICPVDRRNTASQSQTACWQCGTCDMLVLSVEKPDRSQELRCALGSRIAHMPRSEKSSGCKATPSLENLEAPAVAAGSRTGTGILGRLISYRTRCTLTRASQLLHYDVSILTTEQETHFWILPRSPGAPKPCLEPQGKTRSRPSFVESTQKHKSGWHPRPTVLLPTARNNPAFQNPECLEAQSLSSHPTPPHLDESPHLRLNVALRLRTARRQAAKQGRKDINTSSYVAMYRRTFVATQKSCKRRGKGPTLLQQ